MKIDYESITITQIEDNIEGYEFVCSGDSKSVEMKRKGE